MSVFDLFAKLLLAQKAAGSPILAELRRLAKNEIRMEANAAQAPAPDGCKIGGKPYLPRNFVWPTFVSPDDGAARPLSFFCQIDLADIRPYDKENLLPARGILSFFYECQSSRWGFDPNDKGAARVFFFENTEGFASCDPPSDLEADFVIPEIAVAFTTDLSYPGYEELEFHSALQCDWEDYDETIETFLGFSPV